MKYCTFFRLKDNCARRAYFLIFFSGIKKKRSFRAPAGEKRKGSNY